MLHIPLYRMFRSLSIFLASAAATTVIVLGIAQLPGGERVSQTLNSTAEHWFNVPFETQLISAMSELQRPEQRQMMIQLVMQHIAKEARLARHEDISTRPPAGTVGTLPHLVMQSDQALQAMRRDNTVTINPGQPLFESRGSENLNGWAALAFFLVAVFWVSLRRG